MIIIQTEVSYDSKFPSGEKSIFEDVIITGPRPLQYGMDQALKTVRTV